MADGSTKPIEDIKVGDKVRATDPKTGETRIETVTAEIKGEGLKHLVKVTIDTDGDRGTKTAEITATDGHPFWVPELDEWIDATDLESGQWLHTGAGTQVQITAVERWTSSGATVHNLTVGNTHTYYVLAAGVAVLVHNALPCEADMEDGLRRAEQAAGSFDNPGGMSGHAILDDGTRFDLSSGGDGRNLAPGHVAPPGTTAENFHHLENQVAAIMRRTGQNATLYITGSYGACKYCLPSMRAMLPDGGRLLLIWRNDSGAIRNRMFIGGADS
ncbi:polymorphic toxin-type HINT domain-containing protein [Streptomyces cavourensis]|uniref:polymorphic toxin-type HINT domain-containing protein n=2 Tax=Streptomyces TaxID=1883 RepID=UPI003F5D5096